MKPVEQVHVHAALAPFDVTDVAWLLHFFFLRFTSRVPVHRCRLLLLSLPLLCVLLLLLLVLGAEGAQWLDP